MFSFVRGQCHILNNVWVFINVGASISEQGWAFISFHFANLDECSSKKRVKILSFGKHVRAETHYYNMLAYFSLDNESTTSTPVIVSIPQPIFQLISCRTLRRRILSNLCLSALMPKEKLREKEKGNRKQERDDMLQSRRTCVVVIMTKWIKDLHPQGYLHSVSETNGWNHRHCVV